MFRKTIYLIEFTINISLEISIFKKHHQIFAFHADKRKAGNGSFMRDFANESVIFYSLY